MFDHKRKLIITTGDLDGVGAEVTSKALAQLSIPENIDLIVYRSKKINQPEFQLLNDRKDINYIFSDKPPAEWVFQSGTECFNRKAHALVTAPLSKTEIIASGFTEIGHTEILKNICKVKYTFMVFVGEHFNVLLLTGHVPIKKISNLLNFELLEAAGHAANDFVKTFNLKKNIALLGLNPHAGEEGLMGHEEKELFKPFLYNFSTTLDIQGPIVPDAAFLKQNWSKFSLFLCPYHDQGLIAFKTIHGHDSGVHLSLGLPFLRTSVNHGTAKDLFRQDKANPASMKEAIQLAIHSISEGV